MRADVEFAERPHDLPVELLDRHWRQRQGPPIAVADVEAERVVDEVERDLERAVVVVRDRRRGQPPRCHIEHDLPPVIHAGRTRETDLAHDLGPHMQGLVGVEPGRQRQGGPGALLGHRLSRRDYLPTYMFSFTPCSNFTVYPSPAHRVLTS